jgi:hypothetical protein
MERNPIGSTSQNTTITALRWFLAQTPGEANQLAWRYRNDLLTRQRSTATTSRRLSVVKSVVKYARMTGLITWAIEVSGPRIERGRDVRGPSLGTVQAMLALAASWRACRTRTHESAGRRPLRRGRAHIR